MNVNSSELQRLRTYLAGIFVLWLISVSGFGWMLHRLSAHEVVQAHELVIVDAHGTPRVRIAAPVPEPITMGTRRTRDDSVSGVMLYDALGNERGGYVTDNSVGNAFLTLDSNIGQDVTLVAYPNGGAELGLNDDAKNKVAFAALKSGPRMLMISNGANVFQQPKP